MKKLMLSLLAIVLAGSLSGCTVKKTQIAYTVYPVGYIASRVVGDKLQVVPIQNDEIVQRSTIDENFEEILKQSQVLFHIGTLEPYLSVNSEKIKGTGVQLKDLSSMNAIYKFQRYTPVNVDGKTTYIESPYYKGEMFDAIDTDERDLYLWTDPIAMLSMGKDIKKWACANFEEQCPVFEENIEVLETDLVRVDAEYQKLATKLANEGKEIKFVSMTSSFGNWQKTYGIQVYPIILSKYGALPTAEQLQIIKNRIIADGVQYIVYEPNMPQDMIDLFKELETELNLKAVDLSNLSSLTQTERDNNKDYLSIMYENLGVLESMATEIPVFTPTSKIIEEIPEPTASPKAE